MFVCSVCARLAAPGEASVVVVTATRSVRYPRREHAHPKHGKRRDAWKDDRGGSGVEAVASVVACAACAAERR